MNVSYSMSYLVIVFCVTLRWLFVSHEWYVIGFTSRAIGWTDGALKCKGNVKMFVFWFLECLANFLIGEGKLESYLEEFPPIDANINKARTGLTEAKRYLLSTANDQGKKVSWPNMMK